MLIDRADRRRFVIATQALALVQAAALAALTLSGRIELWQIYALAAVAGSISVFDVPARQVMIGPAVAGVLVGVWGEYLPRRMRMYLARAPVPA